MRRIQITATMGLSVILGVAVVVIAFLAISLVQAEQRIDKLTSSQIAVDQSSQDVIAGRPGGGGGKSKASRGGGGRKEAAKTAGDRRARDRGAVERSRGDRPKGAKERADRRPAEREERSQRLKDRRKELADRRDRPDRPAQLPSDGRPNRPERPPSADRPDRPVQLPSDGRPNRPGRPPDANRPNRPDWEKKYRSKRYKSSKWRDRYYEDGIIVYYDDRPIYVFLDESYLTSSLTVALISNLPGAKGDVRVWLNSEMDPPILVANALVEGLSQDTSYTLCIGDLLMDIGEADEQGSLFLENAVIFTRSTVTGLAASIYEGGSCDGEPALSTVVS